MARHFLVVAILLHGLCLTANASSAEPVRIGILGFDNYQAVAYTQLFNNPKAEGELAGLRVVAALPTISADYPESAALTERWKKQLTDLYAKDAAPPIEFVESVEELLKRCDSVMIMSLDSRQHLSEATAVLKAGKRLFIGRPLAASPADAVAIFKLAAETKVPCWSTSQHRFSPGFIGMRNHHEVGRVLGCDVYGAYDEKAAKADEFIRPLHSIETLFTIMGPGVASVSCTSTPAYESITAVWRDGRVGTYRGIKQGKVKYSATVFGDQGVSTAGIYGHGVPVNGVVPTNDKYMGYEGLAIEMAKFFKGATPPVSAAETLEIYALLQAAEESKAKQGIAVALPDLAKGLATQLD